MIVAAYVRVSTSRQVRLQTIDPEEEWTFVAQVPAVVSQEQFDLAREKLCSCGWGTRSSRLLQDLTLINSSQGA